MSLTNEDKDWIASTIRTAIREETREVIREETRELIREETRRIVIEETRRIVIEETRRIVIEETRHFATREDLERVETSLLTEFHKWAVPVDQKLRSHREALRALDLQIEAIAGRVEKLEAAQEPKH